MSDQGVDLEALRAEGRVLLNRVELASAFKVALPTIDRWIERGCPAVQRGGQGKAYVFDLQQVRSWSESEIDRLQKEEAAKLEEIKKVQQELDLRQSDDPADDLSFKLQAQYYQVDETREKRARARKFLVETAKVRQEFDRCFAYLADRLQSLPDYLERRCALTPDAVEALGEAIDEWQGELARQMQKDQFGEQDDLAA